MAEMGTPEGKRFEIRPGAPVVGPDDEIGRVERVVVSPGRGDVTGLVVRKGLLLRRDVVIPIEAVEDASEDLVRVRLSAGELSDLPEYRDEDFTRPPAEWQSPHGQGPQGVLFRLPRLLTQRGLQPARAGQTEAVAGGRAIQARQQVVCRDGEVGRLDLVLLDPTSHRATHFVVRRGGLLGRDTIIPVEWVREISRERIVLDVARAQLDQLPEYRSDGEITADVLDALWDHPDLRPADLQFVEVQTTDGILELHGLTLTERSPATIEAIARGVRGVLGVRNRLQSFEALAAAIHQGQHVRSGEPPLGSRDG